MTSYTFSLTTIIILFLCCGLYDMYGTPPVIRQTNKTNERLTGLTPNEAGQRVESLSVPISTWMCKYPNRKIIAIATNGYGASIVVYEIVDTSKEPPVKE